MENAGNDLSLFARIRQDERLALNTLFAGYYQKLCSFANTYVNRVEAEEIVADVFVTLWKNRHRLEIERNLKAYLYTAVKHAAFAVLKKRHPQVENIDESFDILCGIADTSCPERTLDLLELQHYVGKTIDNLPVRCRQVFILNRLEGLKYKEISEILGISEKTVENHLVKALSVMRESIAKYESGSDTAKTVLTTT